MLIIFYYKSIYDFPHFADVLQVGHSWPWMYGESLATTKVSLFYFIVYHILFLYFIVLSILDAATMNSSTFPYRR